MSQRIREPTQRPGLRRTVRQTGQFREIIAFTESQTKSVRNVNLAMSIFGILAMVSLVLTFVANPGTAAFYRSGALSPHGILALVVLGAYWDEERFDIAFSIAASILAFLADLFVAILGWSRYVSPASDIDLTLGTLGIVEPIIATILTLLALASIVSNFIWYQRRTRFLTSLAARNLRMRTRQQSRRRQAPFLARDTETTSGTPYSGLTRDAALFEEAERAEKVFTSKINRRTIVTAGNVGWRNFNRASGVILTILAVFITSLQVAFFSEVSFYRAATLIVPAHLAGAQLSYFGGVRRSWRFILLTFAILSTASAIYALVCEMPRFVRLASSSGTPLGAIETTIADDESWRGFIYPIVALVVTLFSVVSIISAIASFVVSPPPRPAAASRQRRA